MALIELIFVLSGACILLAWLGCMFTMLAPKVFSTIPGNFFTSMGKWAGRAFGEHTEQLLAAVLPDLLSSIWAHTVFSIITGGSGGIGKAYAEEFARLGLNVVIISRSKEKLDRVARELENKMDRKVMVIVADLTKDDIDGHIKNIQGLEVAVLVNNVGILPSHLPYKFLDTVHLEEKINQMVNCNVKAMVKMCHIVLPGMVERGQGIILNISSGMSKTPWPLYTLYSSTKVFVEIFSRGLQAEYKSNGILIQSVCPFGVSTAMTGFQKPSITTLTPEEFVRSSLRYLKAGEQTYGSVRHAVLGWIIQAIPTWVLRKEAFHRSFQEYVKKQVGG